MEFAKAIAAAIKGKAPIVAIPVEGHAPVCIRQKNLKVGLKGVTIVSVSIEGDARMLVVRGTASEGRVRTCTKFASIDRRTAVKELGKWSAKEAMKIQAKRLQGALSPEARKAAKLAAIEAEGKDAETAELRSAVSTVANIKAALSEPLEVVSYSDETKADMLAWRSSKRTRGMMGRITRRQTAIRSEVVALTGSYTQLRRRQRWNKRKRVLKAAVSAQVIALVAELKSLANQYDALLETFPLRTYSKGYEWEYSRRESPRKPMFRVLVDQSQSPDFRIRRAQLLAAARATITRLTPKLATIIPIRYGCHHQYTVDRIAA